MKGITAMSRERAAPSFLILGTFALFLAAQPVTSPRSQADGLMLPRAVAPSIAELRRLALQSLEVVSQSSNTLRSDDFATI
jgi:hypothetical protein